MICQKNGYLFLGANAPLGPASSEALSVCLSVCMQCMYVCNILIPSPLIHLLRKLNRLHLRSYGR